MGLVEMQHAVDIAGVDEGPVRTRFMTRVFLIFSGLALLSLGAGLGSEWLGTSLVLGGHTDDPTVREIVIGNNVIAAPSNYIRFERARRDGVAGRLDLYMRWPQLDGYTPAARDDFNDANGKRDIIFFAFEPKMMSRDMSGRFEPIYKSLIVTPGRAGANKLTLYAFSAASGYLNEELAVAARVGAEPFVARCLSDRSEAESLAPCERDVQIGDNLSLTYRFPRELLDGWQKLDADVTAKALSMLKMER